MPGLRRPEAGPHDARALPIASAAYPAGLRDLADPPACVYLLGGSPPGVDEAVAIVGSRAASDYGLAQARRLAADLARLGFVVVSGLARGIDAAAHRGALEAGGRTVAVIPSGLDAIAPRHHRALATEIAGRGTLLSEWAHGDPRGRGVFVARNRLIAALSAATVVVEAAERSGALTTAAAAARLGRPVLAVPGDVDRETARGCHALLRAGAVLCEQAADVLAAIGRADPARAAPPELDRSVAGVAQGAAARRPAEDGTGSPGPGAPPEARMRAALDRAPRTVESLAARAGLSVAAALAALLHLQWAGAAVARPGQRWVRGGS